MKKVKAILSTFFHSLVPQDIYYPKLLHTQVKYSIKYFLVFLFVFSFLFTLLVFNMYPPQKVIDYKNAITHSLLSFPSDVVIRIKDGKLETNQNKPFFLWIYQGQKPLFVFMAHDKDDLPFTSTPLPILFLGGDMMQLSFKGTAFLTHYPTANEYLVTKDTVNKMVNLNNNLFPPLLFFFYFFMFIILPLAFASWTIMLILINVLISFVILRLFIPHLHLLKCLQAAIHGTHIPVIVTMILLILFPTSPNILIISSSLMFVFTLVAVYEMYSKSLHGVHHHTKGR